MATVKPRRCTSKTAKGTRCKRNALDGTDPPRCVSHVAGLVGRKSKLEEAITDRLVGLLKAGNYIDVALTAAGVGRSTFYDWLERGTSEGTAQADAPYREFRERIEQARAEGEARNVAIVMKAATSDWKAAAWMLERSYPERWARTTQRPVADNNLPRPGDPTAETPPTRPGNAFDDLDDAPLTQDELAARRAARR
jgi:transposase